MTSADGVSFQLRISVFISEHPKQTRVFVLSVLIFASFSIEGVNNQTLSTGIVTVKSSHDTKHNPVRFFFLLTKATNHLFFSKSLCCTKKIILDLGLLVGDSFP